MEKSIAVLSSLINKQFIEYSFYDHPAVAMCIVHAVCLKLAYQYFYVECSQDVIGQTSCQDTAWVLTMLTFLLL